MNIQETKRLWTVSELNGYLKEKLDTDRFLRNIWLRGEVSNFRHYRSGHMYFTIKDVGGCLKAVMFRANNARLLFNPEDGMQVIARGYLSVYEKDGQYQLYVQEMQPDGKGGLHLAFEQLKSKLQHEGLFREELKKSIPLIPKKIGVVTSPDGAALRDIITVCRKRHPGIEIILSPAAVQGDAAPLEIAGAIEKLNRYGDVEVMIVGRGGGSLEELWAFNTEVVARAIFQSKIPIISAVGHETDFTIADFVADVRAATPTAAAQIAVPVKEELRQMVEQNFLAIRSLINYRIRWEKERLERLKSRDLLQNPRKMFDGYHLRLDSIYIKIQKENSTYLKQLKSRLEKSAAELDALSPLAVIKRGYAICQDEEGRIVKDAVSRKNGDLVNVRLNRGSLFCEVKEVIAGGD